MFRKPKRKAKKAGRKKLASDEEEEDQEASRELRETLKRAKHEHGGGKPRAASAGGSDNNDDSGAVGALWASSSSSFSARNNAPSQKDLATATVQHHPKSMEAISKSKSMSDPKRNKFLAGPIRAPTNIRTTCRFDYQPDICKDYKDTGFCGFGDTCIYLHDRGDTLSGWQLEKVWEEKQKTKKKEQEEQMERFMSKVDGMDGNNNNNNSNNHETNKQALSSDDDGLPFACFLSRKAFEDPIVTTCGHYFSQGWLQDHYQSRGDQSCPICNRDTHGVMNQPTKLVAKKRKLLGRKATWQEFMDSRGGKRGSGDSDDDGFNA